jgi:hypothetical protein
VPYAVILLAITGATWVALFAWARPALRFGLNALLAIQAFFPAVFLYAVVKGHAQAPSLQAAEMMLSTISALITAPLAVIVWRRARRSSNR